MVAEPFGHLGEIGSPAVSPRPSQTSLPPSQTIVQPSQASLRPSQAIAKPSASHEGEIGLLYVYSLAAALCPLVLCCSQLPWGKPLRRDQAALCLLTLCCSLSKPLTEPQSRTGIILLRLRSAANQSQRVSKTRADEFVIWIISCHRRAIWERSCLRDNLLPHGEHMVLIVVEVEIVQLLRRLPLIRRQSNSTYQTWLDNANRLGGSLEI